MPLSDTRLDQKTKNYLLELQIQLQQKVPNATLSITNLPQVPSIKLALIDGAYPQAELTQEQIEALMDEPPYWSFCWASGQVMARYLFDNSELVRGLTSVDFGCGSGVVAIAAAKAGAQKSIALDIDLNALKVSHLNATLNEVDIELSESIECVNIDKSKATLLIADVFYDADNIPLLQGFIDDYDDVIIADSRIKPQALDGVIEVARISSCTVPDLAEASDFNSVGIYRLASKVHKI